MVSHLQLGLARRSTRAGLDINNRALIGGLSNWRQRVGLKGNNRILKLGQFSAIGLFSAGKGDGGGVYLYRTETTAPQISFPTSNCSPMIANTRLSHARLASPFLRRTTSWPPLCQKIGRRHAARGRHRHGEGEPYKPIQAYEVVFKK